MEKGKINFYTILEDFFKNKKTGKISICKISITLLILGLFLFVAIWLQKKCPILGNGLALLLQFFIFLFLMVGFITITVNEKNEGRKMMAFVTNIIFILSTTILISIAIYFNHIIFQIISLFIQLIMLYCINRCVEIKTGDDLSLLKVANYIMASIVTAIMFFNKESISNCNIKCIVEKIQNFIGYYYIVPLMMLQGLYELLDRKSKKLNDSPNSEV